MGESYLKPLHCGISVADIEASIKWYGEMLNFELEWCKEVPELNAVLAFLKHGDFEIELFQHHESMPLPKERLMPDEDIKTQGTKHVCFETQDIKGLFDRLREKGCDIVMGPNPMEGTLMGFIRDNNGTLIEFIQKNL
ncbi:MAG: VOC family protein [Desulfobacteraceae bacterium]|nr:VOC family protein [Desulfobacteraceae bacterium]